MEKIINATSYIILAMREKWMNLILDGTKTAEVRRTRPARPCDMPDYIYLYHRGCIHGMAEVRAFRRMTDWYEVEATCRQYYKEACMESAKAMHVFLSGAISPCLYLLGRVARFDKPIPVPCRPQSWQYATSELLDIINGNGDQK